MDVMVNKKYCDVVLGLVKNVEQNAIEFALPLGEVWVDVDAETMEQVESILADDELALFAIDSQTKKVILDGESPEVVLG